MARKAPKSEKFRPVGASKILAAYPVQVTKPKGLMAEAANVGIAIAVERARPKKMTVVAIIRWRAPFKTVLPQPRLPLAYHVDHAA